MKITKRILAVLLLATLLVSCLLVSVSAEDPFNADGINDIEDVMEYYDLEDYLAENYEDGTYNADFYTGIGSAVEIDPVDDYNKVLKVAGKGDKYSNSSVTDKLVVSFDLFYDFSMVGEYKLDIKMLDAAEVENLTYNTMFSVNTREGAFQYSVWDSSLNNGEGGFVVTDFTGITPEADVWYNVVIFFDAENDSYNFKISDDGKENWVVSDTYSLGGAKKVTSFELKTTTKRSDTILLYLDNVEVYAGTFERNPANKNNITAQTLIDLEALYLADDTTAEDRVRIGEVLDQLINKYGFTPAQSTPEIEKVNAIMAKAPEYINLAFAEALVIRANSIDETAGYYARVDFVEASKYYSESIPADEDLPSSPGFADDPALVEAVIAARLRFMEEAMACFKAEEDSIAFVKAMYSYNAASTDYDGYLKNFYETVASYEFRDDTYAEAVDGVADFTMADAVLLFEGFDAKYTKLNSAANTFIEGATMMKDALAIMATSSPRQQDYEEAFADLAEGYKLADSVYNGGDIDENLDETTHAVLSGLFGVYLDNSDYVVEQITLCENFLDIIKKAQTATYYTAILEHLDAADACLENLRDKYEGVPEALEVYYSLSEAVEGAESASAAYINAVNAVVSAETFDAKQTAIETALILKAEGDVIGIAGVKEANIALSEEMTRIETIISSSEMLKTLVLEIQAEASFVLRRQLLARAEVAASNAEASIEGVAEALEQFNTFKAEYADMVAAMNATHSTATSNAADLAGAAASDEDVYKAADIIKNFIG